MFSEVCIPQKKKKVLACTVFVLHGACSLARPHQPHLWYGQHCLPEDKAHDVLARSLIMKTTRSGLGEAC